jgi:hypothetical protein
MHQVAAYCNFLAGKPAGKSRYNDFLGSNYITLLNTIFILYKQMIHSNSKSYNFSIKICHMDQPHAKYYQLLTN